MRLRTLGVTFLGVNLLTLRSSRGTLALGQPRSSSQFSSGWCLLSPRLRMGSSAPTSAGVSMLSKSSSRGILALGLPRSSSQFSSGWCLLVPCPTTGFSTPAAVGGSGCGVSLFSQCSSRGIFGLEQSSGFHRRSLTDCSSGGCLLPAHLGTGFHDLALAGVGKAAPQ